MSIVPHELRDKLGWDHRHDRIARDVVREFDLKLPRDRELIRQLAMGRVYMGIKAWKESDNE
jgi:Zn-finger domain-containing protein